MGAAAANLEVYNSFENSQNRLESLLSLSQMVSKQKNPETVLKEIYTRIKLNLQIERAIIFDLDMVEHQVTVSIGPNELLNKSFNLVETGIIFQVAKTGVHYQSDSPYENDPYFNPFLDKLTGHKSESIICTPIYNFHGEMVAVIEIINKKPEKKFRAVDLIYIKYVSEIVGSVMNKYKVDNATKLSKNMSNIRINFMSSLNKYEGKQKLEKFFSVVTREGKSFIKCENFGLFLVDNIRKELWMPPGVTESDIRIPFGKGISGKVAETDEPIITKDAYKLDFFDSTVDGLTGCRTTSVICFPLHEYSKKHTSFNKKSHIVAVAMAINKKKDDAITTFNRSDKDKMKLFCDEVEISLQQLSLELSYLKIHNDTQIRDLNSTIMMNKQNQLSSLILNYQKEDIRHREHIEFVDVSKRQNNLSEDSQLDDWALDILQQSSSQCVGIIVKIFQKHELDKKFNFKLDTLNSFIVAVFDLYHPNPFHNIYHGVHVLHVCYTMLSCETSINASPLQIFSLFIAALCHDLDHPGNNNDFEIKRMSILALKHNDDAVLERHHSEMTFNILQNSESNILGKLSKRDKAEARKLIISSILSTDMSKHFDICKEMTTVTKDNIESNKLLGWMIHAADLSAQALPIEQAKSWGSRVVQEFILQAEKEKKLNLDVAPFMQNLNDEQSILDLQIGFLTFVLLPMWEPFVSLLPNLKFFVSGIQSNLDYYKEKLDKLQQESTDAKLKFHKNI